MRQKEIFMIDNPHIGKGILALLLAVILALLGFMGYWSAASAQMDDGLSMTYQNTLFDTSSVIEVDIDISEDNWAALLENATAEEYYDCDVTINGTTYEHVGLRAKGNTSLSMVASSDSERYSFKIKFDEYVDGQSCDGLSKLVLNNNYSDATMMKEALCYDMFAFLGANASLYNYAKVSVNGEYRGVYLALEPVEESFAIRNYGTGYGQLYKPDSMEMGGPGKTAEEAQLAVKLLEMSQEADFEEQLKLLDTANSAIPGVNDKIDEVNSLVSGLAKPTANVVDDLQSLTIALGEDGLSDDLTRLSKLASDLLKDQKDHGGDAAGLLDHLDELGDLADRVTQNADTALDLVQKLDDTLNTYEPQAQQALTDAKALSDTTQAALKDTHAFLSSAEALLKQSGPSLDDGTRQTLSGLSDALRRSTAGLEQTGTIRNAKDTITSLIDDEWDSHTGGDNNLLLMDAGAVPVSLTSAQNGNPQSVQYIMRTQEIKADEEESQQTLSQQSADQGTFWSRVAAMFRDFWNAITGLFRK